MADKSSGSKKIPKHSHFVDGLKSGHSADSGNCRLLLTAYSETSLDEKEITDLSTLSSTVAAEKNKVVWLHVMGVPDQQLADEINKFFDMHDLASLEDLRTHVRSKFEMLNDQFMLVAWAVSAESGLHTHQVIMVASKSFVVTVQHEQNDLTAPVREKLKKSSNKVRRGGTDYLVYSILDEIVDSYFPVLEHYGEKLESVEDQIIDHPSKRSITQIHSIKRDLLTVRRHTWSLREAINAILRDATEMFEPDTLIHMRDIYDHAVQLIDFVETYRELAADLMDVYLSSISNRMNEVMKVLTIITTIFVPPGLIAAIYGMNFRQDLSPLNMPELSWYFGYPFALTLMFVLALTTLSFFWLKGWLGEPPKFLRVMQKKAKKSNHGHSHGHAEAAHTSSNSSASTQTAPNVATSPAKADESTGKNGKSETTAAKPTSRDLTESK